MDKRMKTVWKIIVLVLVAALSLFLLSGRLSAPETYSHIFESIDEKVSTVMKLTATSTAASAGISSLPNDMCTPIAEKLADFSEYFLLILCVLYSEKYLMTIIGAGTFKIMIPAACAMLALGEFWHPGMMRRLGYKLAAAGIALFLVIPLSIRVSDMIYVTYQSSIDSTIAAAEELTEETTAAAEAAEDQNLFQSIIRGITEGAGNLTERAASILNRFIESLAVMIVTSCVIPVLVLVFFLWLIRLFTGAGGPPQIPRLHPRRAERKDDGEN